MKPSRSPFHPKAGFALVATISMLVLLTVVAVGLLSLSSITLRSSSIESAETRAKANARMALMIAIGELQQHTGHDTRVTATADIINPSYPPVLGVWKSWEGSDHEANGRPIAPQYNAKRQSASSGGRFINYLVSSAATINTPNINDAPSLVRSSSVDGTIPLLADGSLTATDARQIHVVPTEMEDGGRFAWWISGENQKARLAQPYKPRSEDPGALAEMGQSHAIANPDAFGLPALLDDPEPYLPSTEDGKAARKAVTRRTMALIQENNPVEPDRKFHDFSPYSTGLLTNTATGGWRKDLSILTEKWDTIYASYPGGRLPLFRYAPTTGATSQVPKPVLPAANALASNNAAVVAATPAQSGLYPWSDHSLILGYMQPCTYHSACASWASLKSYATAYKNFSNSSGVVTSPFIWDKVAKQSSGAVTAREIYYYKHTQRLHPQIARFQLLVYARVSEDPARLNQNPKKYQMELSYVPFFTLWNPYNVSIQHTISGTMSGSANNAYRNFLGFGWRRSLPGAMAIVDSNTYPNPDLVPNNQYRMLCNGNFQTLDSPNNNVNAYDNGLPSNAAKFGNRWRDLRTWGCWLPEGTLSFKPGEAKIFSTDWIDNGYGFGGGCFRLKEGYNPTAIVGRNFQIMSNLTANRSFWFLFRPDRVTQPYLNRPPGYGFSLSFSNGSTHFGGTAMMPSGPGEEYHNITALSNENEGNQYWPPDEVDEISYSIGELADGPWTPIFSVSFGPRMSIGTGPGTEQIRPTKGVVQNNPMAAMVLSDPGSGDAKDHPVNNTYDFAYHSLPFGSTVTPNLSASSGYIATGCQSGDGLSRLIMCNLPLRPMASLVELEGWSPRGHNPYPPFQCKLIGNSDASPLIPKNQVTPSTLEPAGDAYNLMHDDAYCANHLLFDDWFVSSVAPRPYEFGSDVTKDINTVYEDYLQGDDLLANRSYRRITEDTGLADSEITTLVQAVLNSKDGWLKVASRFEVEGMFNINSTSVDAWKALLGSAKSLERIAVHGANGIIEQDVAKEHVVMNGPIAGDVKAGSGAGFGGQFANASEYTGYRALSDAQIEDLATKIVEQVRLRGPFLSLSEFVNRQLSNNTDLALAGAVQTAINNMDDDPMAILRNPANSLSDNTMPQSDAKLGGAGYEFGEAAEGSSAYGAPGWIRQADILRPIAPILSARDDTFTIRAYGDTRDEKGNIVARAWCEAVVKRTRNFVDRADQADAVDPPTSALNTTFGRRYEIFSFRWLNSSEV